MKIFIIIILNLIVLWIAFEYKKANKMKIEFYNSAYYFTNDLIAHIGFNKNTISEVFKSNSANYSLPFKGAVESYLTNSKVLKSTCLNNEETIQIQEFLNSIGKYDIDGAINNLTFYKLKFEQKYELLKQNFTKKVEPIFKIIIILGLALSVLII